MKTKIHFIACIVLCLSAQNSFAQEKKIYKMDEVDSLPVFLGDTLGAMNFILNHLRYPNDSIVDISIDVQFVITKRGRIKNVKVDEGGWSYLRFPDYEKEAIRAVKQMKKWQPAYRNGQAVDILYWIGVYFHNVDYMQYQDYE